jgi:hypothetical protein
MIGQSGGGTGGRSYRFSGCSGGGVGMRQGGGGHIGGGTAANGGAGGWGGLSPRSGSAVAGADSHHEKLKPLAPSRGFVFMR